MPYQPTFHTPPAVHTQPSVPLLPVLAASGSTLRPPFSANRTRYTLLLHSANVAPNLTVASIGPIAANCWGYSLPQDIALVSEPHFDEGHHLQLPSLCHGCHAVCELRPQGAPSAATTTALPSFALLLVAPSGVLANPAERGGDGVPGFVLLAGLVLAALAVFVWQRGHRGRVRRKLASDFGMDVPFNEQEGGAWGSYLAL